MERTKQEGLNALIERNIQAKLAKGMTNVQTATSRLKKEGKMSLDILVDVGTTRKGTKTEITFHPDVDAKKYTSQIGYPGCTINIEGKGPTPFTMHMHAVRQVAEKLKIPGAYLTSLLLGDAWQKTLAYEILNKHNSWFERDKMLVRAVGPQVRAFLSDRYRRLDSELIFGHHIEEIFANGGALSDGYMDDTKIMIESILPSPIKVETKLNGIVWLAFGTRMDSSDYGDGALNLRSFILNGVCLNGAVRSSIMRMIHLGAKLPDNVPLSPKTYELDSMTTASAIKDITKELYSSTVIKERMLEIKAASEVTVDPVTYIKHLFSTGKLLKGETEEVGKILMMNNPKTGVQGESTLWKISQGITYFANNEQIDARRRMELQEIAGDVFSKALKN